MVKKINQIPTLSTPELVREKREPSIQNPRIKYVLQHVDTSNLVLDIGCELGYISKMISDRGNQVVAIDLGTEILKTTQSLFYKKLNILNLDALNVGDIFRESKFDVVVAGEVIEHVLNPNILL